MEIKNKSKSFAAVVLTDPSLRRLIFFTVTSLIICFLPIYKAIRYIVAKEYGGLSQFNAILYHCITNIIVIIIFYLVLLKKNIGGTTKEVIINRLKLKGKCVIVTGGYRGIGLAAVQEFLKYECHVVLACRSISHMDSVRANLLKKYPDAKIYCVELDLGSYKSIESCANYILKSFPKIDIIVNNAGFLNTKLEYINGLESTFFINYYGHFYLINLLYNRILTSGTLVVNLSSIAHSLLKESDVDYDFIYENNNDNYSNSNLLYRKEYSFSKLCMLYYSQQLQKRFEMQKSEACSVSINPGLVKSEFFRYEQSWFRAMCKNFAFPKTTLQGAQTILYVCLLDRRELAKGSYYSDCKLDYVRHYAKDIKKSEELWRISEEILANKEK
ncbi:oxidoreductase, putative [Plasmodium chabaudi chabaudi]|uniref:Oxidoreductase, putative n=1 Tax=Plasmodium chabaudi chabaudi TaxID=31271 RepID=A0A1C6YKI6_PLACU|nr:oxidoreductase, putative [Plasmodium chabaudi chabaudi]SCN61240.1 oxidoreductase, putative [Plasmodium chabaudi chabaudi]